ncbi:Penicillin-binding protein 1A [Serratia plymuthica]|uniref:Penicillin-binding protein 1A n=1 Tax=Serratia plymuthica TaxID=82996 RepID=A0A2X4Y220_SERPL|nr:Penicillin-binding protein 1A [Serratia plymuthica]
MAVGACGDYQSDADEATAMLADGSNVALPLATMRWARPFKSDTQQGPTPKRVTDVVQAASRCGYAR